MSIFIGRYMNDGDASLRSTDMKKLSAGIVSGLALVSCNQDGSKKAAQDQRPNFIVIVADDLGYTDIGPYGGNIRTPVLDSLASQSLLFSNFHVLPTSSPTRSCLLTGNDNHVTGLGIMSEMDYPVLHNQKLPGYSGHLSNQVVTIPELLKANGYHTYMAGKWHLGEEKGQDPYDRGFEETFCLGTGGGSHWNDSRPLAPPQSMTYTRNGREVSLPEDFYSSKNYTDSVIAFIDRNRADRHPFFLYMSYTAVHDPLHVPKEYIEKYKGKFDLGWDSLRSIRTDNLKKAGLLPADFRLPESKNIPRWATLSAQDKKLIAKDMEVYAGMLEYLDLSIGRLLGYLKKEGLYDNTMVIFLSDNGANGAMATAYPGNADGKYIATFDNSMENRGLKNSYIETGPGWAQASSGPYRMFKSFTTEGGIRAPMMIKMAGTGKYQGEWNRGFVHVSDIMPTILELANVSYPEKYNDQPVHPLIGKSIVPVLKGDSVTVHANDGMGYELFEMKAYIQGKWKILRLPQPYGTGAWQLFDLERDPGETQDLSAEFPAVRDDLIKKWTEYARQNEVFDHRGHYDSLYRKSFNPLDSDD